jgi:hypothetical protein
MVLVFDLPPYEVRRHLPRWARGLTIDVWHDEPDGRDSGTVCKGMSGTDLSWHNIRWAWQHRQHLHYRVWPYLRVKRWLLDRCGECDRRFLWRDARFGYMNGDATYHDKCMTLRNVRGQLDDITRYVQAEAGHTTRWRVEYRLKNLAEAPVVGDGNDAH